MLTSFCFVFNHFLRSRSPEQVIGFHLIKLPKEAAMKPERGGCSRCDAIFRSLAVIVFPAGPDMSGRIESEQ
jgi:hypothetical protein